MALEQHSNVSEDGLRSSALRWLELATVVYAWTDKRDSSEDRSWWKTAGARMYLPFAKRPDTPIVSAVVTPAVERFDKERVVH